MPPFKFPWDARSRNVRLPYITNEGKLPYNMVVATYLYAIAKYQHSEYYIDRYGSCMAAAALHSLLTSLLDATLFTWVSPSQSLSYVCTICIYPRNLAGTPRISCASPPPILPTYLAAKAAHHGKVFEDCGNYTPGQLVQDLWTSWHSTGQTTWH